MANTILAVREQQQHAQYRLPEAARLAIIAASPGAQFSAQIAQQRHAFMAANGGDPFGLHRPDDE